MSAGTGHAAQRTDVDYQAVDPVPCGATRRVLHSVLQLLTVLLVYVPLAIGAVGLLLAAAPQLAAALEPGPAALTSWTFYADALAFSVVVFFGVLPSVSCSWSRSPPAEPDHHTGHGLSCTASTTACTGRSRS